MMVPQRADLEPPQRMNMKHWLGKLVMGTGWVAYEGSIGDNSAHSHHALQLALSPQDMVRMEVDGHSLWATAILVGADVRHRLLADSGAVRLLFVDAESTAGKSLSAALTNSWKTLNRTTALALNQCWDPQAWLSEKQLPQSLLSEFSEPVGSENQPESLGALRVKALIEMLPNRCHENIKLADLAAKAALSPSHFSHLFRDITSMPMRPYLRWLRLGRALHMVAQGDSLTRAAHATGFADAAHLSRTMRRHFGISPSDIVLAMRRS